MANFMRDPFADNPLYSENGRNFKNGSSYNGVVLAGGRRWCVACS
jgi:hypothetical protein